MHELVLRGHHPRRVHRPPGRRARAQGPDAAPRDARARSRCGPPSSATACWPTSRPSAPRCWPTPAGRASASGSGPTSTSSRLNTIVNSYNRNFPKRNDGNANTLAFVTSPDTVVALALAGRRWPSTPRRTRSPTTAARRSASRRRSARSCPTGGSTPATAASSPRRADGRQRQVVVDPGSERLQLLEPFAPWDGQDYFGLAVLMKAQGKCTTDHISAAGKWLRYRGHLENISGNLFLGAVNAFTGGTGEGKDQTDGETRSYPEIARRYAEAGIGWCAIGRRELRRGLEPRARGDGAAVPQRQGDLRPQLRPHPRDQPEEAGPGAADLRRPAPPTT